MSQLHVRRGRLPGVGGDLGARADHARAVGALGLGEPLHPQAALRAQAHRRLLVLADGRLGRSCGSGWRTRFGALGGELHTPAHGREVVVRDGAVEGVRLRGRRGARGRRGRRQRARLGPPQLFADGALPWDFLQRVKMLRQQPEPGLLVRLLDRRRGAGDRVPRARDGVVLRHAARRPARLHAELHRL